MICNINNYDYIVDTLISRYVSTHAHSSISSLKIQYIEIRNVMAKLKKLANEHKECASDLDCKRKELFIISEEIRSKIIDYKMRKNKRTILLPIIKVRQAFININKKSVYNR